MSQQLMPSGHRYFVWPLVAFTCVGLVAGRARGQEAVGKPAAAPPDVAPAMTVGEAVAWALQHNPDIMTIRQQHGIAEAAVLIARTYPFNPQATTAVMGDGGPSSAGITNRVFVEQIARVDVEMRGQGKHRQTAARAALNRTEWEIAFQELLLGVRVVRACNTVAYRRDKLRLIDEALAFQQQTTEQLAKIVEQGRANRADLLLARADLTDARTLRGPAYNQFALVHNDLRRLLGMVDEPLTGVAASLEAVPPRPEPGELVATALGRRPDVQALRMAVDEAEARLKLERANRFGNPSLGPGFEYNETSVFFIGLWAYYPLPVLNTHRGEILQRQAELNRALSAHQAAQVLVRQDVQAALLRLDNAQKVVDAYRNDTFPALAQARDAIDHLLAQGEPGVDVARAVDVRRRLLKARDLYLDALYERSQAFADVAAATGELSLSFVTGALPQ